MNRYKRLTFDDFSVLFFGISFWLICLYPVWKAGAFSHPIDWPTTLHAEGISLSTYGKWFFEYPHNFLTDAFSGDFPVYYNYLPHYLLNLLAKFTGIPPMVLEAVYLGPFWGFLYIVINYLFLSKTFNNKRIALISSVFMAFMWHSRITDIYFTEHASVTTLLHVAFIALMLSVAGLSYIFYVPALCLMYLAYTRRSIQYKIYYGLLLGIIFQSHTLTFINILFINFFYLILNYLFQFWRSLTANGRVGFTFIAGSILIIIITILAFRYVNGSYLLLPPFTFVVATPILFACLFVLDKNKSFYLVSYPISIAISIPYLFLIKDLALASVGNGCIACRYFTISQIVILYFPHFLAALLGIWFLGFSKFRNQKLLIWVLSILLATFILSYNNFVGWGNHPYRFAILLLMPLMIAAAVGIYYGYMKRGIWKVVSVFLAIWFILTIVLNINDVFQNRRPYDNCVSGTQEQYDFLKQVKNNTVAGNDILLTAPEIRVNQAAMLLNYSKERGFIPDNRYILHKERYINRMKLFYFLFPSYPHPDQRAGCKPCENEDGVIHLGNILIKDKQIQHSILQVYGIKHIASLGEPFATIINRQADSFKWQILNNTPSGILVQVSPVTLPGVATFQRGQYHEKYFTVRFNLTKAGENILIVGGNHLSENINSIFVDKQKQTILYRDNSLLLTRKDLAKGEHELTITSTRLNSEDYIYFLNVIHQNDFDKYLSIGEVFYDFDFIEHLSEAKYSNMLSGTVLNTGKELFTHPTAAPATLSYSNVFIKEEAKLSFGVDLKNTSNGVKYTILVNGEAVFDRVYKKPTQENNIIISLEKYYQKSVKIDFIVDPLGNNHCDWAYWKTPRLFYIKNNDLNRILTAF